MNYPSNYKAAIEKVKADWQEAAKRALPKLAWLKGAVSMRFYDKVLRSSEWQVISKEYDKTRKRAAADRPMRLLMKALEQSEKKLEEGEGLNSIDIAIVNAILNNNKSSQYLELHREKQKAELARAGAEEKRKDREEARKDKEEARKDREEARKEELHKITMETAKAELEARKNGGIFHILELEEMTEEQYLAYQEGREY